MRTILLLLISVAVVLPATESNPRDPRVARVLDGFDSTLATAQQRRDAAIQAAEQAFATAATTARTNAVRDLKRLVNNRTDAATTAVVYREVLTLDQEDTDARAFFTAIGTLDQVLAGIQPRVETDLLGNVLGKPSPTISGTGSVLRVWNQHNGRHNDRGAKELKVHLFASDRLVHATDSLTIPWARGNDEHLDIPLPPRIAFNRVRVEVLSWHGQGGGLSEIQLLTENDGRSHVTQWRATASSSYDNRFNPERINDGITTSSGFGVGYWLLPNATAGWVELSAQ